MGQIDVVIVNWNAGRQIHTCIDSIAQHGEGLIGKTVVVDNGSVDGSEACIEIFPNVTLIRAGVNLGFARACNLGAQRANSEYLLFLNPDAVLYADTLPKVWAYMQDPANARVGICGVQLLDGAGHITRSCARFPSAAIFLAHAIGMDRVFPRLGHVMAEWDHTQSREVDHVIGAFFLVRRQLFNALAGFDERFFVYLEDLDFSCRARQAGWRSVYLADAQAFHAGGGTSNQVKAQRLFYSLRSRLLYGFKHFSGTEAWALLFIMLTVEPWIRLGFALLRGSWGDVSHSVQAYVLLVKSLPEVFWLARR